MGSSQKRLFALDAARGVAAFLVMLSHVGALSWVPWDSKLPTWAERSFFMLGSPSVDLFFVLSGFVITRTVLATPLKLKNYIVWRLIRLLPVAWFAVALGWMVKTLISTSSPADSALWQHLSLNITTLDWIGFISLLYPLNLDFAKINIALWSLQPEMLFVFIFPMLLLITQRSPWLFFILFWTISFVLTIATQSFPFLYLPLFFLGMIGAIRPPKILHKYKPYKLVIAGLVWILITNIWVEYNMQDEFGFVKRYLDMWGAFIVIFALSQWKKEPHSTLIFLGKISYSLYVIHLPILMLSAWLAHNWFGLNYWYGGFAGIPFAIICAHLINTHIEQKFIYLSQRYKQTVQK